MTKILTPAEWIAGLALTLPPIALDPREAETRLRAYARVLAAETDPAALTEASLTHVAARLEGNRFPSAGTIVAALHAWWREHRPAPPALPSPQPATRPPPSPDDIARVARLVAACRAAIAAVAPDRAAPRPPREKGATWRFDRSLGRLVRHDQK